MKDNKSLSEIIVPGEEWSDTKRFFGLPISFTHYQLGDGRLNIKRGLLATHYDEVMLYRIYDIKMVQTLGQKLFGVGTVVLYTCDASSPEKLVRLINIKEPLKVRDLLSRRIELARDEKGGQIAEVIGPVG